MGVFASEYLVQNTMTQKLTSIIMGTDITRLLSVDGLVETLVEKAEVIIFMDLLEIIPLFK
jgi:hypothetical protein